MQKVIDTVLWRDIRFTSERYLRSTLSEGKNNNSNLGVFLKKLFKVRILDKCHGLPPFDHISFEILKRHLLQKQYLFLIRNLDIIIGGILGVRGGVLKNCSKSGFLTNVTIRDNLAFFCRDSWHYFVPWELPFISFRSPGSISCGGMRGTRTIP